MQVIQIELRHNKDGRVGKTGWEWMVLLLGLCRGTNDIIFECMNEFFWRKREVLDVGMISVHDAAPFFFLVVFCLSSKDPKRFRELS